MGFLTKIFAFAARKFGSDDQYALGHEYTSTWASAQDQYDYFSNPDNGFANGKPIHITDEKQLEDVARNGGVQAGDLLYWSEVKGEGKDKVVVNHASIISKVEDGKILFAGNTRRQFDTDVRPKLDKYPGGIHIIRIKDEVYEDSKDN